MKCIDTLISSKKNKRVGNHSLEITDDGTELYYYYWTVICEVNHTKGQIIINDGGYGTSSTTRAINDYLRSNYIQSLINAREYQLIDNRR